MYRFLLSRRWLGFAVFVVLLAAVCIRLGIWQFHRLEERRADNRHVETNLAATPAPLATVDSAGSPVSVATEWRTVTVSGTYDGAHQLALRNQTRDNVGPGAEVLTPLRTSDGIGILVDRGWLSTAADPSAIPALPAPPSGQVQVTGWLRADNGAGDSATLPSDGGVRAISSSAVASILDYPLLPGYVALTGQDPPVDAALSGPLQPDLGEGPHFFYGLQWEFFALLALGGYVWFAWSEAHPERTKGSAGHRARVMPPSTGTRAPVTNDAAGESRKAATRANSSGRP